MNNYPIPITISDSLEISSPRKSFMVPEYENVVVAEETAIGFSGNAWIIGAFGVIAGIAVAYYLTKRLRR